MRRLTILALALVFVACSSDSTGPEQESQTPNIAGTWTFSETMNDSEHDISCNNAGTINISQSGSTFNGTYQMQGVCTGPGGSIDNSGTGSISGGQISGSSVSFFADFCQYSGTLSGGSTPNQITGSGTCTIQEQGTTFNFDSNFQASR